MDLTNFKFTKTHEWVMVKDGVATIGITQHAVEELGDIVFVEFKPANSIAEKDSQIGTIESTKAASELFSPIGGKIMQVNDQVIDDPQIVNASPFEQGWMVKIEAKDLSELDSLLTFTQYQDLIK